MVWVGRDDNAGSGLTGASGALPIWSATMDAIGIASYEPYMPDSVQEQQLDRESGLLAGEGCEQVVVIPFIKGFAPEEQAPCAGKDSGGIREWFQRLW